MDVRKADGPSVASALAVPTGQAVGNVSHHLRVPGAGDLIAEAPEPVFLFACGVPAHP
jgi:hypothetical protein